MAVAVLVPSEEGRDLAVFRGPLHGDLAVLHGLRPSIDAEHRKQIFACGAGPTRPRGEKASGVSSATPPGDSAPKRPLPGFRDRAVTVVASCHSLASMPLLLAKKEDTT